ncbi:hypothetical protein DLAC_09562 [Tieghemostelium lacteum]|uniref:Fungal lipase-type domain-containing protein n=1 Tax=Tieghemostelium lacteum TaxID=361077 RepID=A0A151Z6L6_TIELA|nr:hypothetical protein DLAC_09562 [Tieghemostelium lacteum]|eukprot:KYQ89606.1 hypothetical protein DLAC_09562 [Tieghemostelium lacteum]
MDNIKHHIFNCYYSSDASFIKNSEEIIQYLNGEDIRNKHTLTSVINGQILSCNQQFIITRSEYGLDGKPTYYIAFKGSDSMQDFRSDLNTFKEITELGTFHKGFYSRAKLFPRKIVTELISGCNLVMTGFSLGGAVSCIVTLKLLLLDNILEGENRVNSIQCITFGQPLIGEKNIVELLSPLGYIERGYFHFIINEHDPIPRFIGIDKKIQQHTDTLMDIVSNVNNPVLSKIKIVGQFVSSGLRYMNVDLSASNLLANLHCFGIFHILQNSEVTKDILTYHSTNQNDMAILLEMLDFKYENLTLEMKKHHLLATYYKNLVLHGCQYPNVIRNCQVSEIEFLTRIDKLIAKIIDPKKSKLEFTIQGSNLGFIQFLKVYGRSIKDLQHHSMDTVSFEISTQTSNPPTIKYQTYFQSQAYVLTNLLPASYINGGEIEFKFTLITEKDYDKEQLEKKLLEMEKKKKPKSTSK